MQSDLPLEEEGVNLEIYYRKFLEIHYQIVRFRSMIQTCHLRSLRISLSLTTCSHLSIRKRIRRIISFCRWIEEGWGSFRGATWPLTTIHGRGETRSRNWYGRKEMTVTLTGRCKFLHALFMGARGALTCEPLEPRGNLVQPSNNFLRRAKYQERRTGSLIKIAGYAGWHLSG